MHAPQSISSNPLKKGVFRVDNWFVGDKLNGCGSTGFKLIGLGQEKSNNT